MTTSLETAIFAGGCFWCLEALFARVHGVHSVHSGYTGGDPKQADYASVCSGDSGHAEAVRLEFDPDVVSYATLLQVFFAIHDPTTLNRQGHDIGSQYRSAIFTLTPEQEQAAYVQIQQLESTQAFSVPIVTEITTAGAFFPAEADHQRYYQNHQHAPYCQAVITPKYAKFQHNFKHLLTTKG